MQRGGWGEVQRGGDDVVGGGAASVTYGRGGEERLVNVMGAVLFVRLKNENEFLFVNFL